MSGIDDAPEAYGVLEHKGDHNVLRYRRRLPQPPEKVWRALTEEAHLSAWFPTTIEGDSVAGAPLRFSFRAGEGPAFDGVIRVFDPPSVMELLWGDDVLRFELGPDGSGCVLELVVTFPELGKAARDGTGWHVCLDRLDYVAGDAAPPWDPPDRWRALHPVYVAKLGAEASAVGPPEEWERAHPPPDQ